MQWIMKICVRGALGLGAAALLLSGVPAQANPAAGGRIPGKSTAPFGSE